MVPEEIIIGQECICPDGLGRVAAVQYNLQDDRKEVLTIKVDTYIANRGVKWRPELVELIDPRRAECDYMDWSKA